MRLHNAAGFLRLHTAVDTMPPSEWAKKNGACCKAPCQKGWYNAADNLTGLFDHNVTEPGIGQEFAGWIVAKGT